MFLLLDTEAVGANAGQKFEVRPECKAGKSEDDMSGRESERSAALLRGRSICWRNLCFCNITYFSTSAWPVHVSMSGCQSETWKASKSLIAEFKCSLGCLKKRLLVVTHASHCQKPTKANQYAFARVRQGFIEGTASVIETSHYTFNKRTQLLHLTI